MLEIPDEVVEEYARKHFDLMSQDEAYEFVMDNPPEPNGTP